MGEDKSEAKGREPKLKTASQRAGARTILDMKLVTSFWRHNRLDFVRLSLLALVNVALVLAYPRLLGHIVDAIQAGLTRPESFSASSLLWYVGALLALGLAGAFLGGWQPVQWVRSGERFRRHTRTAVFRKVLDKGFGFANRFPSGDVLQRLDSDLADVAHFSSTGIFWPASSVVTLAAALVILARMNLVLTAAAVLPTALMVLVWWRIGPLMDRWWCEWRERMAETNNFLEASYSGIRLVKASAMEERNAGRFRAVLDERVKAAMRGAAINAVSNSARNAVSGVGLLFVLALGGGFVIRGQLSLGEFVTFNAYVLMLVWPMMGIADMFVWIRQTGVEEQRVREIADFPPDVKTGDMTQTSDVRDRVPKLAFNNVSFGYPAAGDKRVNALNDISLDVEPGSRVGIAGTVGSGKSTIIRLLLRLAEPTSGDITIGGVPLREYDVVSLRSLFGYAPQEPGLFSETIAENIRLGRDDGDVAAAARVAQLDADLKEMPRGLEELIGERGLKLSGGQRGRVAIARALYGRPQVLLLDDVTASLDAETEQQFIVDFLEHTRGATIVIVSHRLAILAACDIIYVLDQGRVVEQGTHQDLLARGGLYRQLYERQLSREAGG